MSMTPVEVRHQHLRRRHTAGASGARYLDDRERVAAAQLPHLLGQRRILASESLYGAYERGRLFP